MLNELLVAERGARQAGVQMLVRHGDIHHAGRLPTLRVEMTSDSDVASVSPVPPAVDAWTIRDGNHNSFPFVQIKAPFWQPLADHPLWDGSLGRRDGDKRRVALLEFSSKAVLNPEAVAAWPSYFERLRQRHDELLALESTEAAVVPAAFSRFLRASDPSVGGNAGRLLKGIVAAVIAQLEQTPAPEWVEVALALFIGKRKTGAWESAGGVLFDAAGVERSILDAALIEPVTEALKRASSSDAKRAPASRCGLTGLVVELVRDKFPQPNLPLLGQTYLFARNNATPANARYGRSSTDTMPVGRETADRLAAVVDALTVDERKGVTWRPIPSEVPKQTDLLLAFVEGAPDAPVAAALADEDDASNSADAAVDSVAAFEKRTERLIQAIQAKVTADFRLTPVRLAILRRVDPGNRKVVFAGSPTIAELHHAATTWHDGERNVPPWIALPIFFKGERMPRLTSPPHVAPLGLTGFSRQCFVRGGTDHEESVGLPASIALNLFLRGDANVATRVMRVTLSRRMALVIGMAHALRRKPGAAKAFDRPEVRHEAMRTVTVLGVLLHKLGRTKEEYMTDLAFRLGQLLAAADVVHIGYCADVRGGDTPPSLLGNQVFTLAQAAPQKALATLCRRWKPYDGWAKKAARDPARIDALVNAKDPRDQRRGWDIRRALRHAREMSALADELAPALPSCTVNDAFRAELLLGYIAGLPKAQPTANAGDEQVDQTPGQED